jgi:hypothetical protein
LQVPPGERGFGHLSSDLTLVGGNVVHAAGRFKSED